MSKLLEDQSRTGSSLVSDDDSNQEIFMEENIMYLVSNGKALNLGSSSQLRSENITRISAVNQQSTFAELQPASLYTQLPPIDTLSGSQPEKIVNNSNEIQYVLYNNDWK